uniref:Uncharacterized protein n=1 Tax=Strigamia maritima TaxID=126957 RepID=T1J9W4_STRMM
MKAYLLCFLLLSAVLLIGTAEGKSKMKMEISKRPGLNCYDSCRWAAPSGYKLKEASAKSSTKCKCKYKSY